MIELKFMGSASEVRAEMKAFLAETAAPQAPAPTFEPAEKPETVKPAEPEAPAAETRKQETSARKYGESDWDKARRTKEQMATDKEIDELAGALGVEIDKTVPADRLVMQLREQSAAGAAESEANISSNPEDRKDPAEEALTGEIVDDTVYTRDDVRQKLGEYAEKFGMASAQKEGPKLLGATKLSEIPDTPEAFKAAIDNLTAAIEADING